jgi:hypothetical protein
MPIQGDAERVSPIEVIHRVCRGAWDAAMADEYVPMP